MRENISTNVLQFGTGYSNNIWSYYAGADHPSLSRVQLTFEVRPYRRTYTKTANVQFLDFSRMSFSYPILNKDSMSAAGVY